MSTVTLQKWVKKGLVFAASNNAEWMITHAQVPFAELVTSSALRVYFGTRDRQQRTSTAYVDVDPADPARIIHVSTTRLLGPGVAGQFDDCGAMPSWIVGHGGEKYLYYTGWNTGTTIPYRLAIGLAKSIDGGVSFEKLSVGPVLDRSVHDPVWVAQPCVLLEGDRWRMWYLSCTRCENIKGRMEPFYNVKYAESRDGIDWVRTGITCIDYDGFTQAIGRPSVFKDGGLYKMYYSYRSASDYRTDPRASYRIGYAESRDGVSWVRKDGEAGIERSAEGWDSDMIAYCHVVDCAGKRYMFYNGNGFGKSGFGYAEYQNS